MSDTKKDPKPDHVVTLIQDPFGISTPAIAEIQDSNEELDLDAELDLAEDLEINEETVAYDMASLARAMRAETERHAEEIESVVAEASSQLEAENEALLAHQIAEDEALKQAEAAEQALEAEQDPELRAAMPSQPTLAADGTLDLSELQSCIETLLFMSDKPMRTERLQELLGPEIGFSMFQEALTQLRDRYQAVHHGFELVEVGGGYQFRTKAGRAALARKLAKVQTQRLSSGAMESLAIIAYKQPVLKDDVDQIRGVDSSHFIRTLLDRKLITISGRSELPGRPMLYSTTPEFLELFSLASLDDMPSLTELEQMVPSSESRNEEDPRVREMRRLVGEMKENSQSILDYDPREDDQILKDIRERVSSIPTSTPYLEEQKALEKAEKEAREAAARGEIPANTELPVALGETAPLPLEVPPPVQAAPAYERISAD